MEFLVESNGGLQTNSRRVRLRATRDNQSGVLGDNQIGFRYMDMKVGTADETLVYPVQSVAGWTANTGTTTPYSNNELVEHAQD